MSQFDQPLVSVVVPIYNIERYVEECIVSILNQSYSKIEIVLVDDGSTDSSGEICDRYALIDQRIQVHHKENGGLSSARNAGIRHASGLYVSFVDGDDYLSPCFIEVLLGMVLETDCLIAAVAGGTQFADGDRARLAPREDADKLAKRSAVMPERAYQQGVLYQRYATGTQLRLYRKSVLGTDPFPLGIYYEDSATTFRFVHDAGDIAFLESRDLYAYRIRSASIIRKAYSELKLRSALAVSGLIYRNISEWYPDLRKAAASRCFSICRMVFAQIPVRMRDDRATLWNHMKRYRREIILDANARKRERIAVLFAFFGMHSLSLFCRLCRKAGLLA